MANNTEKYKNLFITEAEEKIVDLNSALLNLEKKPNDSTFANDAMRAAHTLKSSAAALNFMEISHLAHAMENFFDQVRSAGQTLAPRSIEMLFQSVDMLAASLTVIKKGEKELSTRTLIEKLQSKKEGEEKSKTSTHELAPIETIRVGVATLNKLMNLTEEFLVTKMRFEEMLRKTADEAGKLDVGELKVIAESFGRLTRDLQYNVTQAYMVPLGQLFEQTPRMVRDLAKEQGKEVELSIVGQDIELDRTVMDRLGEPLIHLLRNAVDHGIEKSGKITLSAERRRDSVMVSVHNEGKPIDWERVVEVAVRRGIISEKKGKNFRLNAEEIYKKSEIINQKSEIENLLYQLSTKKTVTETSGRGVGLGIVKSVIESLGGRVAIESNESGTSFILTLPLTLAIIQALLIRVADQVFALPFSQVDRLVRVPFADIKKAFDQEVAVVDEEDIPMIRLNQLFTSTREVAGIFLSDEELQKTKHQLKAELMIVTKPDSTASVGLVVDEVFSEQNIVVKPLKGILRKTRGFAGVTLLGDGRPALILDVATLI